MLGVVADRFPKGGAMTLNITSGVGMIGAGVIGAVILGFVQDKTIDKSLSAYDAGHSTTLHGNYVTQVKQSIFGDYLAVDASKLEKAPAEDLHTVNAVRESAKKSALKTVAIFPVVMFICYVALMYYFKLKGGYRAIHLKDTHSQDKAYDQN